MGWAVGYDENHKRDIGYGVPAICDHPNCNKEIHRGLANVCGGEPYGGEHGCGLFFCETHRQLLEVEEAPRFISLCERCSHDEPEPNFKPKPDTAEWMNWKLTDESWTQWRDENPNEVTKINQALGD